jgi:hypothetical protein
MSLTQKSILATLRSKHANEALIARTTRLLDDRSLVRESGEAVLAVSEYVCQVRDHCPDGIDDDALSEIADALTYGLWKGQGLDAWDRRALDVIALQGDAGSLETLEFTVMLRVEDEPDHPVFDEVLDHMRSLGRWLDDMFVVSWLVKCHHSYHRSEGRLSSSGRWLLARLRDDAEATLAAARRALSSEGPVKDKTENLLPILAVHDPSLFDREAEGVANKGPRARALVLSLMLELDAARYEEKVVELARQLPPDHSCGAAARAIHERLPGKYPELVKSLLARAMEAHPNDAQAMLLAWPALGDEARDIWALYCDENHALRLKCYAQLEEQAGAAVVPWLVERLVEHKRWNWKSMYGDVTKSKYLVGILRLLRKHPVDEHLPAIQLALKGEKSKAVKRALDDLLGVEPAPAARYFSGKDGYRMDVYAEALLAAALKATAEATLPSPIETLVFAAPGSDGTILLPYLSVEGGGESLEIEIATPETRIPVHVDLEDDDEILQRFHELHELDEEDRERVCWGDTMQLPHCVFIYEHHLVAERLRDALRARGIEFTPNAIVGTTKDPILEPRRRLEAMCREGMLELLPEQRADMAAVLYESPEKQRWLLDSST